MTKQEAIKEIEGALAWADYDWEDVAISAGAVRKLLSLIKKPRRADRGKSAKKD